MILVNTDFISGKIRKPFKSLGADGIIAIRYATMRLPRLWPVRPK